MKNKFDDNNQYKLNEETIILTNRGKKAIDEAINKLN